MTMQEMSTAVQYELPIKIFILNNEWMGMVRQWQQAAARRALQPLLLRKPARFVKLAEAYGALGLRADHPDELDAKIMQMISSPKPCCSTAG